MCVESQSPDAANHGFRSLEELSRNFQQRQIAAKRGFRSLKELSKDFQERQIIAKCGFRSLNELIQDFQQRSIINLDACQMYTTTELPAAKPANLVACYDRAELLAAFGALRAAGDHASAMVGRGIRTIYLPWTKAKAARANGLDERRFVTMEARLAGESVAAYPSYMKNMKNDETFGMCERVNVSGHVNVAGHSIPLSYFSNEGDLDSSTAASDGTSAEQEMV